MRLQGSEEHCLSIEGIGKDLTHLSLLTSSLQIQDEGKLLDENVILVSLSPLKSFPPRP